MAEEITLENICLLKVKMEVNKYQEQLKLEELLSILY